MVTSETTTGDSDSVRVSSLLGILRRQWALVTGCALAGVVLAVLAALLLPVTYSASTVVVVAPLPTNPLSTTAPSSRDISTETEARVVASSSVAQRVAAASGGTSVTSDLLDRLSVTSPANSQVLVIAYADSTPAAAALGANGFADAYLSYRTDLANDRKRAIATGIDQRIRGLQAQLAGQPAAVRAGLAVEIADLRRQAGELGVAPVVAGEVVDRATLPSTSRTRRLPLFLVSGLLLGTLAGIALALVRNRRDDRLVGADDLQEQLCAPVLIDLPQPPRRAAAGSWSALLDDPDGDMAEGYRVLAAKLEAPSINRGASRFLVVDRSGSSAATAADVAMALALRGRSTVLVAPYGRLEFLALADRQLGLSVLALDEGGVGSSGAALHEVSALSQRFEHVVVDGSDMRESQMLALASATDGALVAARQDRSARLPLRRLVTELEQVGTPVLGGIHFANHGQRGSHGRRSGSTAPAGGGRPQDAWGGAGTLVPVEPAAAGPIPHAPDVTPPPDPRSTSSTRL